MLGLSLPFYGTDRRRSKLSATNFSKLTVDCLRIDFTENVLLFAADDDALNVMEVLGTLNKVRIGQGFFCKSKCY